MESLLGKRVRARIDEVGEAFYFLRAGEDVLRLAVNEGTHEVGDVVTGLVYRDKEDHLRLTTLAVACDITHFGWGRVSEVRRDLGVFVAVGLPDKDVVVSLDELPLAKEEWPKVGDQLYLRLEVDKKERLWGHLAWHEDFWAMAKPGFDNMHDEDLRAIVYRNRETGTFVYLPDNQMLGFIHPSERPRTLRIGEEVMVRVVGFRKEDRTLYVSAKPRAHEMLADDGEMLLAFLRASGGTMKFNDKSSPEAISAQFGISKGQFKRALGGLLKAGKVRQTAEGVHLL
ncbi:MAG: RNA-binding protein [Streptococcaceae bacterium]|jgi:predicted RNA-binding protein (virulence factor B family)|nr:RNA-binding protein [Streptococcaceae bacterium]